MLPHPGKKTQARNSHTEAARTTAAALELVPHSPDNDAALVSRIDTDGPAACCPTCGRPHFDLRASGVLDMVLLAQDVLADLKAAIEEETLP